MGLSLGALIGKGIQDLTVDYLEGEAEDFVKFIAIAIQQRGMPRDEDELTWLAKRAFGFVMKHGEPTPATVQAWLSRT